MKVIYYLIFGLTVPALSGAGFAKLGYDTSSVIFWTLNMAVVAISVGICRILIDLHDIKNSYELTSD